MELLLAQELLEAVAEAPPLVELLVDAHAVPVALPPEGGALPVGDGVPLCVALPQAVPEGGALRVGVPPLGVGDREGSSEALLLGEAHAVAVPAPLRVGDGVPAVVALTLAVQLAEGLAVAQCVLVALTNGDADIDSEGGTEPVELELGDAEEEDVAVPGTVGVVCNLRTSTPAEEEVCVTFTQSKNKI